MHSLQTNGSKDEQNTALRRPLSGQHNVKLKTRRHVIARYEQHEPY